MTRDPRAELRDWIGRVEARRFAVRDEDKTVIAPAADALLRQLEAADALIKSILFVVDNNPRLVGRAGLVKAADTFLDLRDAHLTEGTPDRRV